MNNIIEWVGPNGYQDKMTYITTPDIDSIEATKDNVIEWFIPERGPERTVRQRLDDLEKGYSVWYEVDEPYSRFISTWLTQALLHATEHSGQIDLDDWPAQHNDNDEIYIEFGYWRVQLWFTCQPPLDDEQLYMPQFDGVIFNKASHETMTFVLREYDDNIDGIIFCNNSANADKLVMDIVNRYFSELYKFPDKRNDAYYGGFDA